ncbi:MAG: aminotransferase class IV, partial [Planctomycetota bacterium]|nr:aminotransferase class IV [Planctomycetota bacterium]
VVTPPLPDGILPGVTRDWILATLASAGKPFGEESIGEPRLRAADEVFLTGTIKGVMPVARVDDDPVGDGAPGPMTRWLGAAYEAALASLSRS